MQNQTLMTWIQLLTSVWVFLGLGLVIWELQQVRTLARAQLTSDNFSINFSISFASSTAIMGEDAAKVLAKACLEPGALNLRETTLLGHYYEQQMSLVLLTKLLTGRDGVY